MPLTDKGITQMSFEEYKKKARRVINLSKPTDFSVTFHIDSETGKLSLVFGGYVPSTETIGYIMNEVKFSLIEMAQNKEDNERQDKKTTGLAN